MSGVLKQCFFWFYHGIESGGSTESLYHGECVALGMLPLCGEAIRPRVLAVLKKCGLYRTPAYRWDRIAEAAFHDKKADGGRVTVVTVEEIGRFDMKTMACAEVLERAKQVLMELDK